MENEKYINEYNSRLREFNKSENEIYVKLEKKGVIILSSLRSELEGERLELDMNREEMNENILNYLIMVINELRNE